MMKQQSEAQQATDDAAYMNAILDRLVEQYLANTPLPNNSGQLSITLFHHLYRHVMVEGYGK